MDEDDRVDAETRGVGTSPRVRDQPSLTTSSGRSWLVLGGLLTVISAGVLIGMLPLRPPGVALTGLCFVIALYAGMIVVRLNVAAGRLMLGLLAGCMIAIALVALTCALVVAAHQL